MCSCPVLFIDLRMFLAVIFGFRSEINALDLVIYNYVLNCHTVGVDYVRHTIISNILR